MTNPALSQPLRALWLVRSDLREHPGGDTTQILETASALRERNVSVTLSSNPHPALDGADIVHLFHLERTWENLRWIRQAGTHPPPLVLTPIYWPSDEFDRNGRFGIQRALVSTLGIAPLRALRPTLLTLLGALRERTLGAISLEIPSPERSARSILNGVDALLPGSHGEQRALESRFSPLPPTFVTPVGYDDQTFSLASGLGEARRSKVVCVGRIEPRKNQLGLIRALANTSIELTLVGQPGRFHERYARACHAAATANMNFIEWQDSHSLREIYAEARVHACPSWYETPGLVNLEAAACGCRLAVTSRGSTREHFGDEAEYCDPGDPDSIRNSVEKALARGPSLELAHRLGREYTWTAAAESTRKAYDQVLSATRKSQPNASDE